MASISWWKLRAHPRGGVLRKSPFPSAFAGMPLCRGGARSYALPMAETGMRAAGGSVMGAASAERLSQGGGVSRHAHDRPISGDQGGQCRLPPVLSHGRFLRAVLRGRRDRLARARHRADQARQASGRGHPHVRRAGACRRRLPPAADRGRATASRSASRSRTRPRPRSAGPRRWCAATWCASSPRARSPRRRCSMRARTTSSPLCSARPAKEGSEPGYALASLDISTGELIASSVGAGDLAGELARLKPGEVLAGDDLAGDAALRRLIEEAGAALTPCPRAHFDSQRGERALEGAARRGRARCVRRIHPRRACGARRPAHLCRDHPGRQSAAAPPAAQRERRQPAHHRRRHARQSRADALEPGRARRQPARRHRPHRHRGWRARACEPARQPADRSGRGECAARCGRLSRRRASAAAEPARGAEAGSRPCPRAGASGAWARRSARSRRGWRGDPRGACALAQASRVARAPSACRKSSPRSGIASKPRLREIEQVARGGARRDASPQRARRRLHQGRRRRRSRRAPAPARRQPPGHRRLAGDLCRGDRHQIAESPPQQRARLFRRGHRAAWRAC